VITAAAIKCMGGALQGRLWPRNDYERTALTEQGYDVEQVLTQDDLVNTDNCFFAATGVTDGDLLQGVQFDARFCHTQSLVMRSRSGTVRLIEGRHHLRKARDI
ncbi:MAG: fructose-bisphosphatase class II family protein, partial [Acidimicrobiaceae bacterium]|nr:fructose-bisphosphatase class II family protein [Acidimicrobiaceae bacterium]